MGKFAHHHFDHDQNHKKIQRSSNGKSRKNPIKVTYISSPMKVKASNASEFRAIVQKLTGKNSDVTTAAVLPLDEEANQAEQHAKIVSPAAADDFLSHLTSVDQLQFDREHFFWRDVSAERSFGFQSPNCVSSYNYSHTDI